ncbi:MAG: Rrf2 family transcriptional regulator [Acidobacteria bacterium]|nr:Rrf2 family transcriptional regulator [Acidobacteriota bacterium]
MFSQTVEYALRAAVALASEPAVPLRVVDLAPTTQVPADYLAKVMNQLARADLVRAQRGRNGGYTLTRPPQSISLLEVVNAVDPLRRITHCPLNLRAHAGKLCGLHRKLDDAIAHMEAALASSTLAEMAAGTDGVKPLCDQPHHQPELIHVA